MYKKFPYKKGSKMIIKGHDIKIKVEFREKKNHEFLIANDGIFQSAYFENLPAAYFFIHENYKDWDCDEVVALLSVAVDCEDDISSYVDLYEEEVPYYLNTFGVYTIISDVLGIGYAYDTELQITLDNGGKTTTKNISIDISEWKIAEVLDQINDCIASFKLDVKENSKILLSYGPCTENGEIDDEFVDGSKRVLSIRYAKAFDIYDMAWLFETNLKISAKLSD